MAARCFISFLLLLFVSCHKDAPEGSLTAFTDDFEHYASVNDLVGTANNQWTEFNINEVNLSTNPISLDSTIVHSGRHSVRFDCLQDDPGYTAVGKCNLNKGNLDLRAGQTLYYSAWYYIQHPDQHYGTFFIWDLGQIVHGSLEIRVMAWEQNIELERNKLGLPNIFQEQPAVLFPVNQWAHFEMEVKLSQYDKGSVKMWLDGNQILDKDHVRTMPKDLATFVVGTKSYYERVQVGITAKSGTQDLVMYVDDVDIHTK